MRSWLIFTVLRTLSSSNPSGQLLKTWLWIDIFGFLEPQTPNIAVHLRQIDSWIASKLNLKLPTLCKSPPKKMISKNLVLARENQVRAPYLSLEMNDLALERNQGHRILSYQWRCQDVTPTLQVMFYHHIYSQVPETFHFLFIVIIIHNGEYRLHASWIRSSSWDNNSRVIISIDFY
jgi:hypothetical protein